jgi:hypothetical protein
MRPPPAARRWSSQVRARAAATLMLAVITLALIIDGAPVGVLLLPVAITLLNGGLLLARLRFERGLPSERRGVSLCRRRPSS